MRGARQRRTDTVRRAYTCSTCGGAVFLGRDQGRAAIRQNYPGVKTLRPYRSCDGQGFHLGNIAPEVVAGEASRAEVYGPARRAAPRSTDPKEEA